MVGNTSTGVLLVSTPGEYDVLEYKMSSISVNTLQPFIDNHHFFALFAAKSTSEPRYGRAIFASKETQ